MISEISAGLSSAKAVFDIAKGLHAAATQAEINDVRIELQNHVLTMQSALSAAQLAETAAADRVRNLEQEIVKLKNWEREKGRYKLKRFEPGVLAYELQPALGASEPPHRICAACYERGEKGYLQATTQVLMRYRHFECSACKTIIPMGRETNEPETRESPAAGITSDYDPYAKGIV